MDSVVSNGGGEPSAVALLVEWANGQDRWVRVLTNEVIETGRPIGEGRALHFLDVLLREKELKTCDTVPVPHIHAVGVATATSAQQARQEYLK